MSSCCFLVSIIMFTGSLKFVCFLNLWIAICAIHTKMYLYTVINVVVFCGVLPNQKQVHDVTFLYTKNFEFA